MLIKIGEVEYSATDALRNPSMNDLFYLKVKTRSEEFPEGVSLVKLHTYLQRVATVKHVGDLVDDLEAMLGLRCLVWLAKRHAGEKVTVDEANEFSLSDLAFVKEDSDQALIDEARAKRPFGRRRRK